MKASCSRTSIDDKSSPIAHKLLPIKTFFTENSCFFIGCLNEALVGERVFPSFSKSPLQRITSLICKKIVPYQLSNLNESAILTSTAQTFNGLITLKDGDYFWTVVNLFNQGMMGATIAGWTTIRRLAILLFMGVCVCVFLFQHV